jgi:hypothetical protein
MCQTIQARKNQYVIELMESSIMMMFMIIPKVELVQRLPTLIREDNENRKQKGPKLNHISSSSSSSTSLERRGNLPVPVSTYDPILPTLLDKQNEFVSGIK